MIRIVEDRLSRTVYVDEIQGVSFWTNKPTGATYLRFNVGKEAVQIRLTDAELTDLRDAMEAGK